ncbi:hypothetical protein CASFOL_012442 [Castilleja foliolosa]|uniref:Uncharacterized protein n=1 Tax=Castilleja foliolosa TaxID=1961234 RepID=A0ABD3DKJ8_9LAMI
MSRVQIVRPFSSTASSAATFWRAKSTSLPPFTSSSASPT